MTLQCSLRKEDHC